VIRHWHVPVIAQTVGGAPASTLVNDHASLVVPGCGPVVVNAGQSGYYRTLYNPQAFASLSASYAKLAPIDQLGVLDDTLALGLAGSQSASSVLDLIKATPTDANPLLWGNIAGMLMDLNHYYREGDPGQAAFDAFAIAKLEPVLNQIGWEAKAGEPTTVAILRNRLIITLGRTSDRSIGHAGSIAHNHHGGSGLQCRPGDLGSAACTGTDGKNFSGKGHFICTAGHGEG
jgi:hypothetical protein